MRSSFRAGFQRFGARISAQRITRSGIALDEDASAQGHLPVVIQGR
jgi:hypothetical protein